MTTAAWVALQLFSLVCMWVFVGSCINDAADAARDKDPAAARDYTLMAAAGFLAYVLVSVFV